MSKNLTLIILAGITILVIGVLIFLFSFQSPEDLSVPLLELDDQIYLHIDEVLESEKSFVQQFSNPINSSTEEYKAVFSKAQEVLSPTINYPKEISNDYRLTNIIAWKDAREGLFAYYTKDDRQFIFKITSSGSLEDLYGSPDQELLLENNRTFQMWTFENLLTNIKNNVLVFDSTEIGGVTFYHVIESSDLNFQELVDIANSSL